MSFFIINIFFIINKYNIFFIINKYGARNKILFARRDL